MAGKVLYPERKKGKRDKGIKGERFR